MSVNTIIEALSNKGAPRVLTATTIRRLIERHNFADAAASDTIINSLVNVKALHRVTDNVYLNYLQLPMPSPAEALRIAVPDGFLSLHTVLGQSGVLNNPTFTYMCVRKASILQRETEIDLIGSRFSNKNPSPLYHVYAMEKGYILGMQADHIDSSFSYPRATVERAFCDWLYLAAEERQIISSPPPLDCDISLMDMDRLERVASDLGVTDDLQLWLERHAEYNADADNDANMSLAIGF